MGQGAAFVTREGSLVLIKKTKQKKNGFVKIYVRRAFTHSFPFYWALGCPGKGGHGCDWRLEVILHNKYLPLSVAGHSQKHQFLSL